MAEKEERILCIETYEKIAECGYGDFYNTITRQEAIERIAKALCLCDDDGGCKGICNPKCEVWKYSLKHAEAALNALLEGK